MARTGKRTETRAWKRKRGRLVEARLRKASTRLRHVKDAQRFSWLAHRVMLPHLLSDVARRLGSPDISPKDFFCGCAPCAADGLPICEGVKRGCRFAGKWTPEKAAAAETGDALDEFEFQWELACLGYFGKRLPDAMERALVAKF